MSAIGVVGIVALVVAFTPIGSGDYGQWLMVSRGFTGEDRPEYRALADVPPMVPLLIGLLRGATNDAVAALHATSLILVGALGGAFFAAGAAIDRRAATGLLALVLAILVSDRFLDLFAFGGLLQAAALALMVASVAAAMASIQDRARERRWWLLMGIALVGACGAHVPTASLALPIVVAAAAIAALPAPGEAVASRARTLWPLAGVLLAAVGVWLALVAPASLGYVANPASLAYRGPERVLELLSDHIPTFAIACLGAGWLVTLGARIVVRRAPLRRPATVVLIWAVTAWAAFAFFALTGAATDYPRFGPILLAPLVVGAAGGLADVAARLARRFPRRLNGERGLAAIALVVAMTGPFTIAAYQTNAVGYELPDAAALGELAMWTDSRLIEGTSIAAPTREGKWLEGLTGRAALFSSQVRYAFRPVEWSRSLAADALLRGNLSLANEAFVVTLTDGVATPTGQQPRAISFTVNHGGDDVELLREVVGSTVVRDATGASIASLPNLAPAGLDREVTADRVAATTTWTVKRGGQPFDTDRPPRWSGASRRQPFPRRSIGARPVGSLELELRPPPGVTIVNVATSGGIADVTFARIGRTEPRLRVSVVGGSIAQSETAASFSARPAPTSRPRSRHCRPGAPRAHSRSSIPSQSSSATPSAR